MRASMVLPHPLSRNDRKRFSVFYMKARDIRGGEAQRVVAVGEKAALAAVSFPNSFASMRLSSALIMCLSEYLCIVRGDSSKEQSQRLIPNGRDTECRSGIREPA